MDILDLLFADVGLEKEFDVHTFTAVRQNLERQLRNARAADQRLFKIIEALTFQNYDLRVRLSVLVRLLVERGLIITDEFVAGILEAKAKDAAKPPAAATPTPVPKPTARSANKTLPKPPKSFSS